MSSNVLTIPKLEKKQTFHGLHGAAKALVIAEYIQKQKGTWLILTEDNLQVHQLKDEIEFFLGKKDVCLLFPDWETLPYDQFSPHQDIISERLSTLFSLSTNNESIVICAINTLMHPVASQAFLHKNSLILKESQKLDIQTFRESLVKSGYYAVNNVMEHGEFSIRGSIIDVYPMGSERPYRLDLLDDELDSISIFDPDTQRTIQHIKEIRILPAKEFPLDEESIALFRRNFREHFSVNPSHSPIYEAVSNGVTAQGIEYYLPMFFTEMTTLFDYLPATSHIVSFDAIHEHAERFYHEVSIRYEERRYDITRPLLAPSEFYLSANDVMTRINEYTYIRCYSETEVKKGNIHTFLTTQGPKLPIDRKHEHPFYALTHYLNESNDSNLIVVESKGRKSVLLDMLSEASIKPVSVDSWKEFLENKSPLAIIIAPLSEGVEFIESHIRIIVEHQLLDTPPTRARASSKVIDPDVMIKSLSEIRVGSPVVHIQFGVGRYEGLQSIEHQGLLNEFLVLAYAGGDKIYVPITNLNQISRYTGSEHAPLHRLGVDTWQKEKTKALEKIHDVAIELLDTYAKRSANTRTPYNIDKQEYQKFASGFPFIETPDQLNAIEEIIQDLTRPMPMDRLICGDVGFGKTEVAMRAAFLAVQNNTQVCILVPTTLLAGQHYENFRDRFADFPINIALMSRFKTGREDTETLKGLTQGKIDILIGTHKVFSHIDAFYKLGLVVVDEEHRFGVKQKEHITKLRNYADILSMTATPIPRTLNMAMAGIRDISLITTPPQKRLAIKTFWQQRHLPALREAILREILRGGQVYFLHNDIKTIERTKQEIEELVPEAKVAIAHGQMREKSLEHIMSDFYHHRFNVLVCTTIIETGIDIPTANTIIIDRADMFGLAQLHQLRGRVGRSHHQAYAYLITPPDKALTSDAKKRLEAFMSLEDLGAGFILATHDLEIRGAGELLGEEQSGNMHTIGFTLFMELLDKAVSALKEGKTPELSAPMHTGTEIELALSAIIPESYIPDVHTRLVFYKRISHAQNKEILENIQIELIERFGLLPDPVKHLLLVSELKQLTTPMGIVKISGTKDTYALHFNEKPNINTNELIKLIQVHSARYKFEGSTRLKANHDNLRGEALLFELMRVVKLLRNDEK